jgi:hypothetical protein
MAGHTPWREISHKTEHDEQRPGWTASIECAGDPAATDHELEVQLVELMHALLDCGGSVSSSTNHDRYGATISVYTDSNSVTQVVNLALANFLTAVGKADLPPWPIVRCDVMTFAEHDAELAE